VVCPLRMDGWIIVSRRWAVNCRAPIQAWQPLRGAPTRQGGLDPHDHRSHGPRPRWGPAAASRAVER